MNFILNRFYVRRQLDIQINITDRLGIRHLKEIKIRDTDLETINKEAKEAGGHR